MEKTITVSAEVRLGSGVEAEFQELIQVSLDCPVCQRKNHLIEFLPEEQYGVCIKTGRSFPGRLLAYEADTAKHDNGTFAEVQFRLAIDFEDFIDTDDGQPAVFAPTFAKAFFTLKCPFCKQLVEGATQNNFERPFETVCKCGMTLCTDEKVQPVIQIV
jgi:hypothetical protein